MTENELDVSTKIDKKAPSSFFIEIGRNNIKNIKTLLLSENDDLINKQDREGLTPLHWAAGNRNLTICNLLLLSPHIDLFLKDSHGRTALDHAKDGGHEQIIQAIMKRMHEDI